MADVTLAEFVLARIAEDEEAARVGNGRVAWLTFRLATGQMAYTTVAHTHHSSTSPWVADGRELKDAANVEEFYDSNRVLAECEAKRRIVTYAAGALNDAGGQGSSLWLVLADLALPYADHPDFRPEWKP